MLGLRRLGGASTGTTAATSPGRNSTARSSARSCDASSPRTLGATAWAALAMPGRRSTPTRRWPSSCGKPTSMAMARFPSRSSRPSPGASARTTGRCTPPAWSSLCSTRTLTARSTKWSSGKSAAFSSGVSLRRGNSKTSGRIWTVPERARSLGSDTSSGCIHQRTPCSASTSLQLPNPAVARRPPALRVEVLPWVPLGRGKAMLGTIRPTTPAAPAGGLGKLTATSVGMIRQGASRAMHG
mmetsp:Transcript_44334/g.128954  ORF Transcript_44334/g.128954 Transcript_44334/m.128954 type:complete len:241 (-) Transcript_44334:611-1333(-)